VGLDGLIFLRQEDLVNGAADIVYEMVFMLGTAPRGYRGIPSLAARARSATLSRMFRAKTLYQGGQLSHTAL